MLLWFNYLLIKLLLATYATLSLGWELYIDKCYLEWVFKKNFKNIVKWSDFKTTVKEVHTATVSKKYKLTKQDTVFALATNLWQAHVSALTFSLRETSSHYKTHLIWISLSPAFLQSAAVSILSNLSAISLDNWMLPGLFTSQQWNWAVTHTIVLRVVLSAAANHPCGNGCIWRQLNSQFMLILFQDPQSSRRH